METNLKKSLNKMKIIELEELSEMLLFPPIYKLFTYFSTN